MRSRVIPILRSIALDPSDTREASRAVFVLAQSGTPEARETVVQVAQLAAEPVRIAAVRELGRFGGPEIPAELMQVYTTANSPVKLQVVSALGERLDRGALFKIAEVETDAHVKARAFVILGQAGGGAQLRTLYTRATRDDKRPIILGLFNARAEDDLMSDRGPGEGSGAAGGDALAAAPPRHPEGQGVSAERGADQVTSESTYE